MNGIGDFISTEKEVKRLAALVMAELKGDYEGHPFRGNQYEGGSSVQHNQSGERANATVGEQAQKIDLEMDSKINQLRGKYPQLGDAYNQMNFAKIQSDYDIAQVGNVLENVNHAENKTIFHEHEISRARERATESDREARRMAAKRAREKYS